MSSRLMALWMLRASDGTVDACDCIVPVPLHRNRFLRRRFNQSAELARHLARASGKPLLAGTLLFMLQGSVALWLAAKLAVVAGIVLCHSACGTLIAKVEREEGTGGSCGRRCGALVIVVAAFIGAALWLVLAKPF